MAESMMGLKRSHRCTELGTANVGEHVTVMGWVQKSRNKGGIIFVDLRDRRSHRGAGIRPADPVRVRDPALPY